MDQPTTLESALHELIQTYHELNFNRVDVRPHPASPAEFLRDVMINRPVVYKGAATELPAYTRWNVDYLLSKMGDCEITVAQTPYGNADSMVFNDADGRNYFVMPYEGPENFKSFIRHLQEQKLNPDNASPRVKYSQSQNNNVEEEYSPLAEDLGNGIPWAEVALGQNPDATNIWIGNERSVSAMHKDNYENLYCQIRGRKKFTLISPLETVCVGEKSLPQARYELTDDPENPFQIMPDSPETLVHGWPTMDPDVGDDENEWWKLCRPIHVVLEPGDILYLPAMWYHKVAQESGDEGICCAVNFWYDMEYSGPFYPTVNFVRNISLLSTLQKKQDDKDADKR
ncbi:Clavaminate synthase-like protein [Ascodesmis nigricans]|uniref:Clavaminate synthase-like protein n=1 Tax=Ascodesmis nigricans TaxID=341454 RepID=A0A4S2MV63_9PEZI|nr:Clavaminate synthase-like protein [Ascodesmis nigricans]